MPRGRVTWVAVVDGGKAILFVNQGSDFKPALSVLSKAELDIPSAREHGTDGPGSDPRWRRRTGTNSARKNSCAVSPSV